MESSMKTKVRIQSVGPNCITVPACITYNRENCTACLEIQAQNFWELCRNIQGYEHLYPGDGCQCQLKRDSKNSINDLTCQLPCSATRARNAGLFDVNGTFMEKLATLRRFKVLGVDKCTETVLFTFQVCSVPLRVPFVYVCGKLVNFCNNPPLCPPPTTMATTTTTTTQAPSPTTTICPPCPTTIPTCENTTPAFDRFGFKIVADLDDYCYEFRYVNLI